MSRSMMVVGAIVLALSVLVWLALLLMLAELNTSDAAGNGMTQGFAGVAVIALWVLMALLLVLSAFAGRMPAVAQMGALLLLPASGAAAFAAIEVAARMPGAGRPWPLIVPAFAPAIIIGFALWVAIPMWRAAVSPAIASTMAGVTLSLLAVAPWPSFRRDHAARAEHLARMNTAYRERRASEATAAQLVTRQRLEQLVQQLAEQPTPNARLWAFMEFLDADRVTRAEAIEAIGTLPTRQADAEELLDANAWKVLYELPNLSLVASPAICANARRFVRQAADKFDDRTDAGPGRTLGYHRVDLYLPSLDWLVSRGCDLRAEMAGIEAGLRAFEPSTERDGYLATIAAWGRRAP